MTPHEGMDHASRRKKYCVAMEKGMHRDGKNNASRGRKKGFFRAENYEFRGRKVRIFYK